MSCIGSSSRKWFKCRIANLPFTNTFLWGRGIFSFLGIGRNQRFKGRWECKSQIIHWCNIKCWWICLQSCFFLFLDFDLMGFPTNFFWQIKKNPLYVTYTNEWFGISNPKDLWNSDSFHFPRIENMPRPQCKEYEEYLRQVCNTAFESVSKRRANTTHHLQIQFYLVSTYISKHSNRILHSCLLDMC